VGVIGWAAALVAGVVLGPAAGAALAGGTPPAQLTSEAQLPGYPNQGIARVRDGWVLSGTGTLSRVDEQLQETLSIADAIPADLRAEGFDHVGDVDVVGGVVHAPLEQPDYSKRRQMMARYDADTLEFLGARPVRQGHASFVTVDPRSRIAYSTDQFDDDRVLRYDLRRNWRRLPPLRLDRRLERIQGGDVAGGALWVSTDDATNGLYRVDLVSGHVIPLGNAGHVDGEGEGIDATALPSGRLHMVTVDAAIVPIWLGHLDVTATADRFANAPGGILQDDEQLDSGWPPVLVGGVVLVVGTAAGASIVMFRRARAALRSPGGRR
jgi:hypothetical protein